MSKIRYNRELLDSCMERDGATLVGEYEKLNRDSNIKFICSCGKEGEKTFKSIKEEGGMYCKDCITKNKTEKFKKTNLERYSVKSVLCIKEVRDKAKIIILEKYGVEYPLQSKEVKDKIKNINLEKHGVEYPKQSKEVRDKFKATNLRNLGVEYPTQSKEVRDKVKATNLRIFGVEYPTQSIEVMDKIKESNIKKYGFQNPMQNPEVAERNLKACLSSKFYILPNGNKIKVQGYENHALNIIFNEWKLNSEDIIVDRTKVPEIWWIDDNNKKRRYFTDIYIPTKNLIIEVKSTWTYNLEKRITQKKLLASKELGYNSLLWVFNDKYKIVEEYKDCSFDLV